eukprot:CAMPEP_0119376656 /NCGR_PEP_ID=MMETSP1334-20130426/40528_1 /TAXON_ID=127549 /ORGANISM="Calcidiscus leptoporus, Strain RCC1130" /LENGTH=40 /DNA_ID= /DNA_START= /DNA_END= /DNA_ORIENTATION=
MYQSMQQTARQHLANTCLDTLRMAALSSAWHARGLAGGGG